MYVYTSWCFGGVGNGAMSCHVRSTCRRSWNDPQVRLETWRHHWSKSVHLLVLPILGPRITKAGDNGAKFQHKLVSQVQLVRPTYIRPQGRLPELRARGTGGTDLWHWQWLRVRRLRRKRCRKTLWMMHVCGGMLQKTPTNGDTLCDKRRKCV